MNAWVASVENNISEAESSSELTPIKSRLTPVKKFGSPIIMSPLVDDVIFCVFVCGGGFSLYYRYTVFNIFVFWYGECML